MKSHSTKYFISLFCVLLTGISCESLDEDPVGLLSPESLFETTDDVEMAITGGYSLLHHEEFWGRKLSLSLLLRGDMATIGNYGTPSRRIEVDEMSMPFDSDMVTAFWLRGYMAIQTLNYAIDGADLVDASEDEINPVVAQGRFLRAWIYYNFVRLFGEIPYINYAITDADDASTISQTPVDEIYEGIIEDLEYAKEWLPNTPSERKRPGKGSAAGLLASVYLTTENWQSAYDEAKYVIDNAGTFQYDLEAEFADLFDPSLTETSNEVLWEINLIGADAATNPSSLGGTNASSDYLAAVTGPIGDERYDFGAGWSVAVPSLAVFEDWDDRDYRKAVSFDTVMVVDGVELLYTDWGSVSGAIARPHIAKYYRALGESEADASSNGRDSDIDSPILRYAEILLIAAESLNEINGGPTAEAIGYVNEVRSRARRELDDDSSNDRTFPEDVSNGSSQDDFRTLVMEERRLELAFEFGRWYDIVRRELGESVFGASGLEQQNFSATKDYLFPKYYYDVENNPNITQNNGY